MRSRRDVHLNPSSICLRKQILARLFILSLSIFGMAAYAAPPIVTTVPVAAEDPIQPHDLISGKPTTLKGAVDEASVGSTWTWDPGDGSATVSGTVDPSPTSFAQTDDVGFTPYFAIWIEHTYTGSDGELFLATLTVTNAAGESSSAQYRMIVRDTTLPVEVNTAIDEALWFMHRNQYRFDGAVVQGNNSATAGTIPMSKWNFPQTGGTASGQTTGAAAVINALEANGYTETDGPASPYTETVARGLRYVVATLTSQTISLQTFGRPAGSPDDPDTNGNGIGIYVNGYQPPYQLGMAMDAIVASGTPDAVAVTGPANVIGRSYRDIVQDMVDWYAWAQGDGTNTGGWRYGAWNNTTGQIDNSTSGWAAIGFLAAEDVFGLTVPPWVKTRNEAGLELTDTESNTSNADGQHGYTNSPSPAWGGFGVTGAAMVEMAMDDIQSTTSATPDERWVRAENFFRRHFGQAISGNNFRNYYYAMFNFAKAMRTAVPEEVVVIGLDNSAGCGPNGGAPGCGAALAPLDWYSDPVIGLARTVVDFQLTSGVNIGMFTDRPGNSQGGHQDEHNTSWATQILTRTLFQAGPVARATASPNPGALNTPISFDGTQSFHQDPARSLVLYEWDFDNDGVFDVSGATAARSFTDTLCPTIPCTLPVTLRVTDDNDPARFDTDIVNVEITIPPHPPTADAGGPYLMCTVEEYPLDGSGSFDIDEGESETGNPPFDTITAYEWELDGVSPFDFAEATGTNPLVSFPAPGIRDIGLRVTDNTSLAFPSAQQPDLTDADFTTLQVADCSCIGPITARTKPGKAQLVWTPVAGAAGYDILRSFEPNRGFEVIAADHTTNYATYLQRGLTNGTTYWYRVVPKGADGMAICPFSQAVSATPQEGRRGTRPELVPVPDVTGLVQSDAENTLAQANLGVGNIAFENSDTVPEGLVIRSEPAPGTSVVVGTLIDLVVSLGPVRVEVPDVVGETQAAAEAAIAAAGLTVGNVSTAHSDTIAAGLVISQDPVGGLLVVAGSAVDIVVSLGPQTTAVPDVVGLLQAAAESAITSASLTVGTVSTANSDVVPAGSVISQNPPARTVVVLNTPVDIVVSLGPQTVVVPNVINQSQAAAEAAIVGAGLSVGTISTQSSSTIVAGNVINQSPGAGTSVLPGTSVDLVISLGPVQVTVPNVVGLSQANAESAIIAAGLGVGAVTTQNSLTVPVGTVISQDPAAGTTVDESSLVDLVVSSGPRQVTVPDVTAIPQADAEAAIVAADLTVGNVTTDTSPTVPAGNVISQNPVGGSTVDEQSAVDLVVSTGPAQITVPNVVGLPQADAEAAIVAGNLQVGVISTQNSATVPAGDVISQNPVAGTTVDEQSAVDLVVSLGPVQVSVPNVVGNTQAAAEAAIIAAGLTVGTVDTVNSETIPAGQVISQDPLGGTTVDEGSAVDIVVSLGAADIEVPNVVGLAQAAAESAIVGAGLSVGTVTTEPSFTVPVGEVISQSPVGGAFAAAGSAVNLVVSDGVPPDDEPPLLSASLDLDPPIYNQGELVELTISASDNSGIVTVTFTLDGGAPQAATLPVTTIDTSGFGLGSTHEIVVTAEDPAANIASQTLAFAIRDPGDTTPPVAALNAPADLAELTSPTSLIGTASDANLRRYQLGLRRTTGTAFTIFAEGTTSVTNDVLADFDPTLLENGIYVVRLVAEDLNGLTSIAERTYVVAGETKPGIYRIGFTDLAVPVAGIPIAVERIYDNRVKSSEDFGFGWRMQILQGSYEHNRTPGLGWRIVASGGFISLPCQSVQETKSHLTEVRLSDREWYQFKLTVSGPAAISGGCVATAGFSFVDGSTPGATLAILQDTEVFHPNGSDEVQNFDPTSPEFLDPYDPGRVRLITIDGRKFDFDVAFGGVTRLQDSNGNSMSISNTGLTHSSGLGISFSRDASNRITEITDPRGNVLRYEYDANGDLVSFFDQVGNETTFEYDSRHNLQTIFDPLGNRANTNEYDADGRIIATTDANGNRVEFTHDIAAREEIITNARGAITRIAYDEEGNVTSEQKAVTIDGAVELATTTWEYDANGNETVIVDPDGQRTEQAFNALNLPLSRVTDPGGLNITQSFSYNSRGDVLTDVDPNGLSQTYAYDGSGNPTAWEDRDGFSMNFVYDSSGNLTGKTDDAGNSRSVSYNSEGQATEEIDALGNRTTFTYDANGNRTSVTVFRTIGGSLTGLTTTYAYDALNNVTEITDPLGNVETFEYNAIGKRSAHVDALGNRTEFEYDNVGALILTRFPDGTTESQTYDSSGNVTSRTDRAGRTTSMEYDELNRLVRTTNPDGTDSSTIYTPGGRIAAIVNEAGERTDFEYDAAGRRTLMRLPAVQNLSGAIVRPEVRNEYDAGGRLVAQIDPLGNRTEYAYDVAAGTVTVANADGTAGVIEFDQVGRMVSSTNEDGQTTLFSYEADSADRLLSVQLPSPDGGTTLGPLTQYSYDEVDNRLTQTDALGRVTTFSYDELNRLSEIVLPNGETRSLTYDAVGNLVTMTDFDGAATTYEYDAMNRLSRKNLPDGSSVDYSYTANGQREEVVDNRGNTSYVYDVRDRIVRVTQPATGEIQYQYDDVGNMVRMTSPNGVANFTYDAMNRVVSLESDGDVIAYDYDEASRLARISTPNDMVADYVFDARGRPTSVVYRTTGGTTVESYTYDYSASGRVDRVEEFDGSVVSFAYDGIGRLTSETRTGANAFVRSHGYDAVGNRTSTVTDGVTTNFTYDVNDQLVGANTTSFTYDDKGNLVQRSGPAGTVDFSWTPENRLASVDDGVGVTTFGYDADGRRVLRQSGGNTTRFLIDDRNPTGFSQVIEETDGTGALLSEYQYGPRLAAGNVGGSRVFYHDDVLRDTRLLTDDTGAVTGTNTFSAYGELISSTGSTNQPHLYKSEHFDPALGAYYLRNRHYDPGIGRFLSRDSFAGLPEEPMSQNPYLYSHSDPVNNFDPSGNFSLISISFSGFIQSTLRAINVSQKATTICRIKGRLALFKAIWTLRSLGNFIGASHEIGAGTSGITGNTPGFSLKTKLWSDQFATPNSLEEVGLEEKWTPPTTFQTELSAKFKKDPGSTTAKVSATKNIATGIWTVEGGFEKEVPLAEIKFCGFVKIGEILVGMETTVSTNVNNPVSGSIKGYLKVGALAVGSLKVTVVNVGF